VTDKYILDVEGNPVAEPDLLAWGKWMQTAERSVARDEFQDVLVSTVFLGLDHGFGDEGAPVLFETMIFGGDLNDYSERYSTRQEAIDGHAKALEMALAAVGK
jgi:hypothetical protein